jgi:hypothetical protein
MSYQSILHQHKQVLGVFDEIARQRLIKFYFRSHKDREKVEAYVEGSPSPLMNKILRGLVQEGTSSIIEAYLQSMAIYNTPKVFRLSNINCQALENVLMNVTFDYINLPFDVTIVELPEDYTTKRFAVCEQGEDLLYGKILPKEHRPVACIVHFDREQKLLLCGTFLSSGQVINYNIYPQSDDETLESAFIDATEKRGTLKGSLAVNEQESKVASLAMRVALNVCNLSNEFGVKRIGRANQSYYDRCEKQIQKSRKLKDEDRLAFWQLEQKIIPIIYEFEQDVKFYDETREKGSGAPTGRSVKMHWRRGHYAMQPYGAGLLLRKRIFRKPTLVNKESVVQ